MRVIYPEPNHICQNPGCTKGADGKPKHYYACNYCSWNQGWRSLCCCKECYLEMQDFGRMRPKRTDKTEEEVEVMMKKSYDEIMEETMEELADFKQEIEEMGIGATVDFINEEIDNNGR